MNRVEPSNCKLPTIIVKGQRMFEQGIVATELQHTVRLTTQQN